jgi:hypothetical protein
VITGLQLTENYQLSAHVKRGGDLLFGTYSIVVNASVWSACMNARHHAYQQMMHAMSRKDEKENAGDVDGMTQYCKLGTIHLLCSPVEHLQLAACRIFDHCMES